MADKLTLLPNTRISPLEALKEQVRLLETGVLPTPNEVVIIYELVSESGQLYPVFSTCTNAGTLWVLEAGKLSLLEEPNPADDGKG